MSYLERAIKNGYANITGPEGKKKITYVSSDNHNENFEDPEERVRAEFWAELIYKYEYPVNRIKVEVTVPDRLPSDRADIVVFSDDDCKRPYAVVECKRGDVTDAEFNQAIEQGVGNATWVKLRAEYVVIIAGGTRRILDVTDKFGSYEREQNILADLPKAYGKPQEFRFYKGTENDIAPVTREELIAAIRKCHQTLWGGGRLSPPTAFGELCKLIFVKISDEQKPRMKGEPYQFQIKTHEPSSKLAERINALYDEQKTKDPEVFTESIKVDDRVLRTVVSHLESINLNKTDLDVKGVAFEQFMDGFFKGDFGQYFTPRPIIEFAVQMIQPEHDWDVLDPACGSGGFLLHALDYMRKQAGEYYDKGTVDYYNYWHDFAAKHLYGIEINDEIARVAKMNMIVHDDGHTNVISYDALDSIDKMHDHNRGFEKNKFDLILTNPPFGSTINNAEKPYLQRYELGNTYDAKGKKKPRKNQSSEILFIERIWEFLKPGTGKAAVVLPDGVLTNGSSKYVRDFILERFQLQAVISLPKDAFAHFGAGVNATIIFLRKLSHFEKKSTNRPYSPVFMAKPIYIGYDATGCETKEKQFPQIISKFNAFSNGEHITDDEQTGYLVPYSELDDRIDVDHYAPKFLKLKYQIEQSIFPISSIEEICISIKTGFAAGKQEQADSLPDDQRVPHLRPFSITSDGQLSFETQKFVPMAGLTSSDICTQGEVLFNNTNSIDWVGKSTVFDSNIKCATSNHITRLKLKEYVDPYYVAAFFNMLLRLGYWKFLCTNFNNQSGINIDTLKKVKIILPPLSVQLAYSKAMVKSQAHADRLRKQAEQEIAEAKNRFENGLLGGQQS
ncbi:hypothetical protein SDC9_53273 [bioreactor metagenome]|uniref:site-specific DNA-methyltransferase (adenine-specific) n=1 Tax=bioreactor metagenome TaxID=1076179 RepID=A0A644WTC1_9ZZZZ